MSRLLAFARLGSRHKVALPATAELLAFDILQGLDWSAGLGDQHEGRTVIDLIDHHRRFARLVGGLLDDGVHVAEAGIVGARHDPRDGRGRAFALVDRHIQAFGFEITLFLRHVIPRVDALMLEVQGKADRCQRLRRCRQGGQQSASERSCDRSATANFVGHDRLLPCGSRAAWCAHNISGAGVSKACASVEGAADPVHRAEFACRCKLFWHRCRVSARRQFRSIVCLSRS
jgi:hypothetical protein